MIPDQRAVEAKKRKANILVFQESLTKLTIETTERRTKDRTILQGIEEKKSDPGKQGADRGPSSKR